MLEHLGLVVHLVPAVAHLLHEPGLDEAVASHDREGTGETGIGQAHRAVGHVRDQPGAAIFFTISVTDEGATPSRSASTFGVMGSGCHSVWAYTVLR